MAISLDELARQFDAAGFEGARLSVVDGKVSAKIDGVPADKKAMAMGVFCSVVGNGIINHEYSGKTLTLSYSEVPKQKSVERRTPGCEPSKRYKLPA
jgi:hypothetical protein